MSEGTSAFEAELIKERTKAGLQAARARGRLGGRTRKMTVTALQMAMSAMLDRHNKPENIAKMLRITTTTLYYYVNGDGTPKNTALQLLSKSKNSEP